MNKIKFGTDGWRARIAEDFTFDNLELVTQAFIEHFKDKGLAEKGVAIGYDNRFLSEKFASAAAQVCSGAGVKTLLTKHSVPSQVLSYTVKTMGLGAGIMITASHNPPVWNGFKVKENFGGSAFPETTAAIESKIKDKLLITPNKLLITESDPDLAYLAKIKSMVNLDFIKNSGLNIIIDPMHGSGAGYFQRLGLPVTEIRGQRDPLFGGVNPEPLAVNLATSIEFVKKSASINSKKLTACIVLDGDADRLAAIDGSGRFINTHNIFCLLLRHLCVHRRLSGEVIKTFNLSNLIDKLCRQYRLKLSVVPIGFKHIAKKIIENDVLMGGEESGGMAVKGFIPERDGILAGLMLLELMATEKKTLAQILDEMMREHGFFHYNRIDLALENAQAIVKKLSAAPPQDFGGMKINNVENMDGLKFNFDDESWILFRASGTEPLLRIYAEGRTPEELENLLSAGKKFAL